MGSPMQWDPPGAAVPAPSGRRRAFRFRKIASRCVFWGGMCAVGVLAIPAGILLCVISLLVRGLDMVTGRLEKTGGA